MLKRSHAIIGAASGVAVANLTGKPLVLSAAIGAVAGLLPDADTPGSAVGRFLPGWWHALTRGHRGPSHSPVGAAAVAALVWWVGGSPTLALLLAVGMGSHICSDAVTEAGVPWCWPLSRRRMALPRLLAIKTGGPVEALVVALVVAVTGWWLWP